MKNFKYSNKANKEVLRVFYLTRTTIASKMYILQYRTISFEGSVKLCIFHKILVIIYFRTFEIVVYTLILEKPFDYIIIILVMYVVKTLAQDSSVTVYAVVLFFIGCDLSFATSLKLSGLILNSYKGLCQYNQR